MNLNNERGNRGAFIIPSARPTYRNYGQSSQYLVNKMVRYGIAEENNEYSESGNDPGNDEIDNAWSKPALPIRSPSRQNKNRYRRNSLRQESTYTEDDDINELSKSVPATLPSQLYCSDDSDDEQPSRNKQHSDLSYQSVASQNTSNLNRSGIQTPEVLEPAIYMRRNDQPHQNNSLIITLLSVLALVLTLCLSMLNMSDKSNKSRYDEFNFYNDVSGFKEKYNVDEDSILQVQAGISTIFEKQDTGSFIFLYNSESDHFNSIEFNKFLNELSFAASKYLRNDSDPVHYTIVEATMLEMKEHSELIARYRKDLDQSGVMLVRHLEAIPSELAMAFHYYCDEYNPLVKKSAIFFTLNLAHCRQESDTKSFHSLIEKCLSEKWSSVPIDSIGPLLTRVVSMVVDVTGIF